MQKRAVRGGSVFELPGFGEAASGSSQAPTTEGAGG